MYYFNMPCSSFLRIWRGISYILFGRTNHLLFLFEVYLLNMNVLWPGPQIKRFGLHLHRSGPLPDSGASTGRPIASDEAVVYSRV